MSDRPALDLPRVRCAPFHEAQAADPIGSAGSYDGFLVVDLPLPWEQEVTGQAPFAEMVDGPTGAVAAGDGSRWRPLARVASQAVRRVTEHRAERATLTRADGSELELRGPYRRREWDVEPDDLVAFGRRLLGLDGDPPGSGAASAGAADPGGAGSGAAGSGAAGSGADGAVATPSPEVLVCTHGRRDQCCGSLGTAMFEELAHVFADSGVRVDAQRISHTGGHRFAPTALTFPDGYAWGHLDAGLVDLLVRRAAPPERFAAHCRGSALFAGAPAQAADRAGLVAVGWAWAEGARGVEVVDFDRSTMATAVRATCRLPDGHVRAFEVVSVPDRHIPSPTCGIVDGPEYGTDVVWRVLAVDEVAVDEVSVRSAG